MSSAGDNRVQRSKNKMRIYLVLALIYILLMAFLSSLGESFVYIFSGLAIFFLFLAWQHWQATSDDDHKNRYNRSDKGSEEGSFTEKMQSMLRSHARAETDTAFSNAGGKKVIMLASAFIGGVFILIIAAVIFTGGNEYSETDSTFFLKQEGDAFYYQGNFDSAYLMYRRGIALDDQFVEGYYGIGNVKAAKKQHDSALYYYDRVLAMAPERYDAAYGKAWVYYDQQNNSRSLQELRYIFNRTDEYQDAFLLAGDNHYTTGQYDSAITYYEGAYNLGSRSKELLNIMAYIYDVKGKQETAIAFYEETLQYDSTLLDVYKRLGELVVGEKGNYYRLKAAGQQW
jgi:tetratricopeptide (TPR) repeat protein